MRRLVPLLLAAAVLAGCGTHKAVKVQTAPATHKTVWLCLPGRAADPCDTSLATTVVRANGTKSVEHLRRPASPPIDCFYVYPTVSDEPTGNASLSIGFSEILVAEAQAAQFSQVCKVYAPVYRQITNRGLVTPSLHASPAMAYGDVVAAWRDYLAHYNHGRGVVLIGHSQGAYALKHLVSTVIDRSPVQRRLLVSAILLGGQVHAANTTAGRGGDFAHVPPCASRTATGCVIAYSSFDRKPPVGAMFGRSRIPGTHIVCVNPGAPGSSVTAPVTPLFPAAVLRLTGATVNVSTPWVAYPGLYTARCEQSGNASWLQVTRTDLPGDTRPAVRPTLGPGWGLHLVDVNIALTDLVSVVRDESRSFAHQG
jgi:predicted small secreted protein